MSIIHPTKLAYVVYRTRRLSINPAGNVLFTADTGNHRIRRIANKP